MRQRITDVGAVFDAFYNGFLSRLRFPVSAPPAGKLPVFLAKTVKLPDRILEKGFTDSIE